MEDGSTDQLAPNLEEWRRLYQTLADVRALAPWQWMQETDVFGLQNPETSELGFVSVLGARGISAGINLYRGLDGLHGFWALEASESEVQPEAVLTIPQLYTLWGERAALEKPDIEVIKSLGMKFRGKDAWPLIRSIIPGCLPWYLEGPEVRFLTVALEQLLDIAPRYRAHPALLDALEGEQYLVRVPSEQAGTLTWEDQIVQVSAPEPQEVELPMDIEALTWLRGMPTSDYVLEVHYYMTLMPVREHKGARPRFPFLLLIVENHQGLVLAADAVPQEATLPLTWAKASLLLAQRLLALGIKPKEVRVKAPILASLFGPLGNEAGFKVKQVRQLPKLDRALVYLEDTLG